MNVTQVLALVALAALPAAALTEEAADLLHPNCICPHCQCQEQIVYKDCITHRCKLVPDNKPIKKTVYEVKEVPFCLPKLPAFCSLFHKKDCCDTGCVECECPRYKRVLVKKEITCGEICTMKCVVEEIVTRVPCRVCTAGCPNCTQPAAPDPVQLPANPPAEQQPTPPAEAQPAAPIPAAVNPPIPSADPLSLGRFLPRVMVAR